MTTKKKSEALLHVREIFGNEVADYLAKGVENGYIPDEEDVLMDFAKDYKSPAVLLLPAEKSLKNKSRRS